MSNPGFCDESEQEIKQNHESQSSDEIAEENKISTASGDSDDEVDSNSMFVCCLATILILLILLSVFAFCACIIHG